MVLWMNAWNKVETYFDYIVRERPTAISYEMTSEN